MLKVLIDWETPLSFVEIVTYHLSKQGDCCNKDSFVQDLLSSSLILFGFHNNK